MAKATKHARWTMYSTSTNYLSEFLNYSIRFKTMERSKASPPAGESTRSSVHRPGTISRGRKRLIDRAEIKEVDRIVIEASTISNTSIVPVRRRPRSDKSVWSAWQELFSVDPVPEEYVGANWIFGCFVCHNCLCNVSRGTSTTPLIYKGYYRDGAALWRSFTCRYLFPPSLLIFLIYFAILRTLYYQ